jgi:hypothetical protein
MAGNKHSIRNMFSPMEEKNPDELNKKSKSGGHSKGKFDANEMT